MLLKGFLDRVKKGVNYPRTILLRDGRSGRPRDTRRDVLNQIGFRHGLYQGVDVPSQYQERPARIKDQAKEPNV